MRCNMTPDTFLINDKQIGAKKRVFFVRAKKCLELWWAFLELSLSLSPKKKRFESHASPRIKEQRSPLWAESGDSPVFPIWDTDKLGRNFRPANSRLSPNKAKGRRRKNQWIHWKNFRNALSPRLIISRDLWYLILSVMCASSFALCYRILSAKFRGLEILKIENIRIADHGRNE